jgi:hypothetical protein
MFSFHFNAAQREMVWGAVWEGRTWMTPECSKLGGCGVYDVELIRQPDYVVLVVVE